MALKPLIAFLAALASIAAAQTLNKSMLVRPVAASDEQLALTSTKGINVGDLAYIDREAMRVVTVSPGGITVTRGLNGTSSEAHARGAMVFTGAASLFLTNGETVKDSGGTTALENSVSETSPTQSNARCSTTAGCQIAATNPLIGSDFNDRRLLDLTVTTDSSTSNPNFSDENVLQITETATHGQALYGSGTNAKKTFLPLAITGNFIGSGQKFLFGETLNCYSMSDCNAETKAVTFAGGPIRGDESQGIQSVSYLQQQSSLSRAKLNAAPVRTACSTNLTQRVTAAQKLQTVTVGSSTGCNVHDWIVLGQEAPTAGPNEIAVQITAVAPGTITGQFVANYPSGTRVTPATVLSTNGYTVPFGQDRVLVNLSAAPYTAGNVTSISGGGLHGSGTSWTTGMVGGGDIVVGCIALTNDDYTGGPFTPDKALKSWYQVLPKGLTATQLGIMTTSVAGDAAYHGNGAGSGAYTIRPCAKVLRVSGNTLILETNSFTWNAGDSVEEAITPYPDVTGYQYQARVWTPGGVRRAWLNIRNTGARAFSSAIMIDDVMPAGGGADTVPWRVGMSIGRTQTGITLGESQSGAALRISATPTTTKSAKPCIVFNGNGNDPCTSNGSLQFDSTTGDLILNGSGSTARLTHTGQSDGKNVFLLANTHLTLDGSAAGSAGPIFWLKAPSAALDLQMRGVSKSDSGGRGINLTEIENGTPRLFGVMGGSYGNKQTAFGAPKTAISTSPATNSPSAVFAWNTSVWNGGAPADRWWLAQAVPGNKGNNAASEWQLQTLAASAKYNSSLISTFFGVNSQGKVRFGEENIRGGAPLAMVTLDPTKLTANRTVTMPDASGTALIASPAPVSSSSACVAGQMAVDATGGFLDVCTAPNTWKRVALSSF